MIKRGSGRRNGPTVRRLFAAVAVALLVAWFPWSVGAAAPEVAAELPLVPIQPATGKAPPLPVAGLQAEPRSADQVGFPVERTKQTIPAGEPQTPERIALGMRLFFDARLSADGTVSCATCHDPARAFTDGRPTSIGIHGRVGQRNAPTVLNALYNKTQFWDGRAATLEDQAVLPITNPDEMGRPDLAGAVSTVAGIPEYEQAFRRVFGQSVNSRDLGRAIAAYERSLTSFDSPFDRYMAGEKEAVGESARRGWELFNTRGKCNKCHALTETERDATTFTDNDFHNIGIGIMKHHVVPSAVEAEKLVANGNASAVDVAAVGTELSALGRFLITRKAPDIAAFKTPDLRNVLVTGPYFHDGSQVTLWDVVDHYNHGDGLHDPWLDEDIQPLALSEQDIDDLVAFLASLTSLPYRELGEREWNRQFQLSRTDRPQRDTARAFGPKPPRPAPPQIGGEGTK